jgi:hypothetical protein
MTALNSELRKLVEELDRHCNVTKTMTADYRASGADAENFEYAAVEVTWSDELNPTHSLSRMVGIEREKGKARVATVCDYCTSADGREYVIETSFDKDGKRAERIFAGSDHSPRGVHREFHANGNLAQEIPYDDNGDVHGHVRTFGENGEMIRKREFKEGNPTGIAWDVKNGKLTVSYHYPRPEGRRVIMNGDSWVEYEQVREVEMPVLKVA